MTFYQTPSTHIMTALGPIRIAITEASHIFAQVEAHINDDKPALVFRGQEYIGGVHLYAEHGWNVDPKGGYNAHFSRRPQWTDAPRTHADALVAAIRDAVIAYVDENPDVLIAAEVARLRNDLEDATEIVARLRRESDAAVKQRNVIRRSLAKMGY